MFGWGVAWSSCLVCLSVLVDVCMLEWAGRCAMWRLPQRLWHEPVVRRVAGYVGDGWDRCEWCDGRPGFPARLDDGVWQFICPECAEPWHHVPYGVGLMELARGLGGLWWFGGSGVASARTSRMRV